MVVVVCYGEEKYYESKEKAVKQFVELANGSETEEQQLRYLNVISELDSGIKICSDSDGRSLPIDYEDVMFRHEIDCVAEEEKMYG